MRKSILKNVLSNWMAMVVNVLVAFFMMPFVIRKLGTSAYGFWALLQALTSYLFVLDFGVRSSLNRHLAKFHAEGAHRKANQAFNTGMSVYLLVCVGILLVSCLLGVTFQRFFSFQELDFTTVFTTVVLIGATVALQFPTAVFNAVLTGLQRYDLMNVAQILSLSFRTVMIILSLSLGYGLVAMSLACFLGSLLNLLLNYALAVKIYPHLRVDLRSANWHMLRLLASHGFYALILILTTRIITDAGTIIVGAFVSVSAVTYYAIAASLTTYAYSVISCITTTIPPAASHLEAIGDEEGLRVLCIGGTKSVLMIGLPILITFILSGDIFLRLWVGEGFGQSYLPLALLSIAWALNYVQSGAVCVLIGLSRHKVAAWMALAQSLLNVSLGIFLVKSTGMVGVAWGAMLASVVMNVVFQVHALRQLQIPIGRFVNQAVLPAAATMVPFTLVLRFLTVAYPSARLVNYFVEVAIAVSCMLLLLPWLGLNSNERLMVRSRFGQWLQLAGSTRPY